MRRLAGPSLLVAAIAFVAQPALAGDPVAAKALFDRGLSDMTAARYDTGCPAIGESYQLDPRPGTLFTLAECEAKRGRVATALSLYDDYLSQYDRLPPDKQQQQGQRRAIAIEQRRMLAPQVALLTLLLAPTAPPATKVLRDDHEVAAAAIGLALPVDPGTHVITIREPGRPPYRLEVTVEAKQKKLLTLPRAPEAPLLSNQRIAAVVAGSVGVVGLLVGAVAGGLTLAKKSTINANCDFAGDPGGCNPTGLSASTTAKTLSYVSTAGFVIGGVGVAAGLTIWFTDKSRADASAGYVRPGVSVGRGSTSPTTFGLEGAF
jgi:hypothetical protein